MRGEVRSFRVGYLERLHQSVRRGVGGRGVTGRARGDLTKATVEFGEFLLAKVGLQDFRHKYPTQLSGGMQRRAELARARINSAQLGGLCHHGCEHAAFHHRGFPVMTAKIIDGNAVVRELRESFKKRT